MYKYFVEDLCIYGHEKFGLQFVYSLSLSGFGIGVINASLVEGVRKYSLCFNLLEEIIEN